MRRFLPGFIVVIVVGLLMAPMALASSKTEISKDVVVLPKEKVLNEDYFAAGDIVEISGTVNGDVYVAGGQVFVDGVINGDLIAAGGVVYLLGKVEQDARIGGGQVVVGGEVGGNITIVGGSLEIANNAKVGGSMVAAGGNIVVNAPIAGEMNVVGGSLTVNNTIDGDLTARVESARLTSNAQVNGDFEYWSQENVLVDKNAYISGTVSRHDVAGDIKVPSKRDLTKIWATIGVALKSISFMTTLIVGLLLIKLFPKCIKNTSSKVSKKFWISFFVGLLGLIVTPILVVVLLITVIGAPLGLMIVPLFITFVFISRIFGIIALGNLLTVKVLRKKEKTIWGFVIGILVYYLLTLVPFVGAITKAFIVTAGFGAGLMSSKNTYISARKENIV